jgi:glycosyltransferase involved in cell wall biosynthesis
VEAATGSGIEFVLNGVEVHVLTRDPFLRAYFAAQEREFNPDAILTSTDDPAHLMLETALAARHARVVYLVRATIALPFGPDSPFPSEAKTAALRRADGVVAVSEYVAQYTRQWGAMDAVHVPISLLEPGEFPCVGRFDNRFVTMVNPCAVKGISILLELARRMPAVEFAAVPTWGTTPADLTALGELPNVTVLPPVDNIHDVMSQTRVALVPSIWAEARSRIILEAMARGIPVLASKVGGLAEAMLGIDYLLPVNPVVRYRSQVDELMVPVADIPEQDVAPWQVVLERLTTDRTHYAQLSARAREAALGYAANLNALPFETLLERVVKAPRRRAQDAGASKRPERALSAERRKLLALQLKRKSGSRNKGSDVD